MTAYLVLILLPLLIGLWAQLRVQSAFEKWSRVGTRRGLTGEQAAQAVLRANGVDDVAIVETQGRLTDHYDPSKKRLALSSANFRGTSVAAVAVAAHEAGHAVQHRVGYPALKLRMSLVPLTLVASNLVYVLIAVGVFAPAFFPKAVIGLVVVFLVLTVFQLITLPVEYDASARAKAQLAHLGVVDADEMQGVSDMLGAAALTYVAAFVSSLMTLLYWLMRAQRR